MIYRFAADRTLGKLAKWLRLIGFDTIFESGTAENIFFDFSDPDRILLTRIQRYQLRSSRCHLLFLESNDPYEQLRQVVQRFNICIDDIKLFSICVRCNQSIISMPKETLFGRIPDYIWETHDKFSRCPKCERIYWSGTHCERSIDHLSRIFYEEPR